LLRGSIAARISRMWIAKLRNMLLGLLLLKLLCVAAANECPTRSDDLRSSSAAGPKAILEFTSNLDIDLLVMWVNDVGLEQASGIVTAYGTLTQHSYVGHAFRFYSSIGPSLLIYEYTVMKEEEEVQLDSCTQNQQEIGYTQGRHQEFTELVHDPKAPCLPANQSSAWSCVRFVSQAEFDTRTPEHFGFANEQEAQDRLVGEMTDLEYTQHVPKIPRLTDGPGYLKMNFTKKLRDALLPLYEEKKKTHMEQHEPIAGGYTNIHINHFDKLNLHQFQDVYVTVVSEMKQVLQWWVGAKLKHTSTFGIRIYRRHGMLINHVDRMDTHLASAVLQVAQQCDGGWPLEVVRENGERYEVYLQPGEMVLYEGAKIQHGRPMRFNGTEFANIFSHFAPIHWNGIGKSPLFKPEDFITKKHDMEL